MAHKNALNFDFYRVFRSSMIILTQLSESFSLLNPWIITLRPSGDVSMDAVTPVTMIVVYAILEPLATKFLAYVAIRPWILLLALSPGHLWWSWFSMEAYDWLDQIRNAALRPRRAAPFDIDKPKAPNPPKTEKSYLQKMYPAMALLIPTCTAAAINAALLLFTQSLYAPSLLEQNPLVPFLAPFTITFNLICRFGDYLLWNRTRKGRSTDRLGRSGFVGALLHQVGLVTIRGCIRILVGLPPLMAFETLTPIEAEEKFRSEQYQWMEGLRLSPLARKAQLILALGGPLLMLLGGYLVNRALQEDLRVRSEQQ